MSLRDASPTFIKWLDQQSDTVKTAVEAAYTAAMPASPSANGYVARKAAVDLARLSYGYSG